MSHNLRICGRYLGLLLLVSFWIDVSGCQSSKRTENNPTPVVQAAMMPVETARNLPRESVTAPVPVTPAAPSVDSRTAVAEREQELPLLAEDEKEVSLPKVKHAEAKTRGLSSVASVSQACSSKEFPGSWTAHALNQEQWTAMLRLFTSVKSDLTEWLADHRHQIAESTASLMITRLKNLQAQRPPSFEEPDLAWRGITVITGDRSGSRVLQIGSGFVTLAERDPERARFEMARTIAQEWAPVVFADQVIDHPWNPFLGCMDLSEGSYDAVWAVSSAVALQISKPGCAVPAFVQPEYKECLAFLIPPTPLLQPHRKIASEQGGSK